MRHKAVLQLRLPGAALRSCLPGAAGDAAAQNTDTKLVRDHVSDDQMCIFVLHDILGRESCHMQNGRQIS